VNDLRLVFPLSDGSTVTVTPSQPLTIETMEELLLYLDVYLRILKKRTVLTDPPTDGPRETDPMEQPR